MMNIDQPLGTRFVLDDGRVVRLTAHEWDGRVRLWVCSWPDPIATKRTGTTIRTAKSGKRQQVVYMGPRAFARRARLHNR